MKLHVLVTENLLNTYNYKAPIDKLGRTYYAVDRMPILKLYPSKERIICDTRKICFMHYKIEKRYTYKGGVDATKISQEEIEKLEPVGTKKVIRLKLDEFPQRLPLWKLDIGDVCVEDIDIPNEATEDIISLNIEKPRYIIHKMLNVGVKLERIYFTWCAQHQTLILLPGQRSIENDQCLLCGQWTMPQAGSKSCDSSSPWNFLDFT